jgi:GNAT superfamily N-acetyltransferase
VTALHTLPVDSTHMRDTFIAVPWRVYRGDPRWVPPLRSECRRQMDRRRNPFFRHADVEHFVAVSPAGEGLGRVAATIYPPYNTRYGTKTGFFGFFESVPDAGVARTLLSTAESWLRARGMTRISGPYSYCSTQEMGLLTDGFDQPAATFQTYNPPYYETLIRDCGYAAEFSMATYRLPAADHRQSFRAVFEKGDAATARARITVRRLDIARFAEEVELIRCLFNRAFEDNDAVLPIERDVFSFQLSALRRFVDPRLITIVERDGRPAGFTLLLPNLNELLMQFNGRIPLWAALTYRRLLRRVRSAVLLLVGAMPELHGAGVGRTLLSEMVRSAFGTDQYRVIYTTWVHQNNGSVRALARRYRAARDKTYVILARDL